jgi:hypothetical protein
MAPKKTIKDEAWRSEFKRLWDELVPPQGQADTVQGEMIRAAGRLADEAYRNGNINFDKGHRLMCKYLRKHLSDPEVFTPDEIAEIDSCVDRFLDARNPDVRLSGSCHHLIAEKVVKWCHWEPNMIPHLANPALRR